MNFMLLSSVLELDPSKELPGFSEKLQYGSTMLLLGMLAVFAVLTIIWLSLVIFKLCFQGISKEKSEASIVTPAPAVEEAIVPQSDDDEIVAVIAAAIAMAESETNGMKFKVVSFRRI